MKHTIRIALLCFLLLMIKSPELQAQVMHPVKWSFSTEQANGETTLLLKATIDVPWHLYSQDIGEGGPIPTSFKFTASDDYELIDKVTEPRSVSFHDPNFDMDLKTFDVSVTFRQKIKAKTTKSFSVKGSLEFMACNDKMCLPPDEVPFEIKVKASGKK